MWFINTLIGISLVLDTVFERKGRWLVFRWECREINTTNPLTCHKTIKINTMTSTNKTFPLTWIYKSKIYHHWLIISFYLKNKPISVVAIPSPITKKFCGCAFQVYYFVVFHLVLRSRFTSGYKISQDNCLKIEQVYMPCTSSAAYWIGTFCVNLTL